MTRYVNGKLDVLADPTSDYGVVSRTYLNKFRARGLRFVWIDAHSLKLSPAGLDGNAQAVLADGTTLKGFTITGDVTVDIANSGANGLDTGSEAADTFYYVWGIGKADGTFALLLSVSATSPTMPTGYTYKKILWGAANDGSSNLYEFLHLQDGKCLYTGTTGSIIGLQVVSTGTSTSAAAIPLERGAPDVAGVSIGVWARAANANATNSAITVGEDSGLTVRLFRQRTVGNSNQLGNQIQWDTNVVRNTGSLSTSLYYKWGTNTANLVFTMIIKWWTLGLRW